MELKDILRDFQEKYKNTESGIDNYGAFCNIRNLITEAYGAGIEAEKEYVIKTIDLHNLPSEGLKWLRWFLTRKATEPAGVALQQMEDSAHQPYNMKQQLIKFRRQHPAVFVISLIYLMFQCPFAGCFVLFLSEEE